MNQFKSIDFKNNKVALSVAKDFDYILNNIWSTYSEPKGISRWREIRGDIPNGFQRKIATEIGHVEIGHGREQALMATKSEMEEYLYYLINS